jgi:hypothetical protein
MGPAHDSGPVSSFQHLHLADSTASLPAPDGNPSFKTNLRTAQDCLIIRTRKYVGRAFYPNLKFQRLTPPAGFLTLLLKSPSSIGAQIPSRNPYQPLSVNSFLGTRLNSFFWETHVVL